MSASKIRLMIYDRTAGGLSLAWSAGARLYRARGLIDGACGAASWDEALDFLEREGADRPIAEIQVAAHGKWGDVRMGAGVLDAGALLRGHPHGARLRRVARRFDGEALLWLRTCETLGAAAGRAFARQLAEEFGCRVAGHTFIIGVLQSGLHALRPGAEPDWDPAEGLREGTPEHPLRAWRSSPGAPRTITCFQGRLPSWA